VPARIGILALQGDVEKHARRLADCGAEALPVRLPADLDGLEGIVLPGGESTTMSRLLRSSGLFEPLAAFMAEKPVLATCAGMILLAREVDRLPYAPFGLMDIAVARNAWGRQVHSFQAEIHWRPPASNGSSPPMSFKAIFIRAPRVLRIGSGVEVLAEIEGEPVAVRQDHLMALAFHPELTEDARIHQWFLDEQLGSGPRSSGARPIEARE
jgi:5'-phosphate synthase pdxT subunit